MLRAARPPDPDGAERRARAVLLAGSPIRSRRRRTRPAAILVAAAVAFAAAAAVAGGGRPGEAVADWVRRTLVSSPPARPPGADGLAGRGTVLAAGRDGTVLIGADGRVRRLGPFRHTTWSARGRFVLGWSVRWLRAVDRRGRIRWSMRAPGAIRSAAWSPDGFRVAYSAAGAGVRVVAGDGTGDHPYGPGATAATLAWRPGSPHTLATVDRRGRVDVRDVDTARLVTRTATPLGRGARSLAWSADGRRLAVERPGMLVVLDVRSGRLQRIALPPGERTTGAAWSPRAPVLALVVRRPGGRASRVVTLSGARLRRVGNHTLAADARLDWPVRLASLAWSPDGRRLVAGWPVTRHWIVIPAEGGRRPMVLPAPDALGAAPRAIGWAPR